MEIRIGVQHRRQTPILERPRTGFVTLLNAVTRNKRKFSSVAIRCVTPDAIGAIGARQRHFVKTRTPANR